MFKNCINNPKGPPRAAPQGTPGSPFHVAPLRYALGNVRHAELIDILKRIRVHFHELLSWLNHAHSSAHMKMGVWRDERFAQALWLL